MASHNQLGKEGEEYAIRYLQNKGYIIYARNWRYGKTEIDIIAGNADFIIFIEVKTRTSGQWGYPEEAVGDSKIRKIVDAADFYVKENDISLPVRFDVISLIRKDNGFEASHFDDAFFAPIT